MQCGIGGPLVNRYGEVIGICFLNFTCTPFSPIHLLLKWGNHYKLNGEPLRPHLGMKLTNLYAANLNVLERNIRNCQVSSRAYLHRLLLPLLSLRSHTPKTLI